MPRLATLLCLVALLGSTGCGDSARTPADPPAPPPAPTEVMDKFARQKIDWHACPLDVTGTYPPALAPRVQCTDIQVPLDYRHAEAGLASMAVLRVAAGDPQARRGVLLLNPGGPGGDGLRMALYFNKLWTGAPADTTVGKNMRTLADRYDLIGFSPRGVGGSSQLHCGSNRILQPVGNTSLERTPEKIDAMVSNARLVAEACKRNPVIDYFNTDSTAQDLELLRRVLNEKKISYYGYSYGTWLGKWFESRFPDSVDRMVLDSSMYFPGNFDDNLALQIMARNRVLDEVYAPMAASRHAIYGLGATGEAVRRAVHAWLPPVQTMVDAALPYSTSARVDLALATLGAARGLNAAMSTVAGQETVDPASLLAQVNAFHYSDDGLANRQMQALAAYLLDDYFTRLQTEPTPIRMEPEAALYRAVVCNDTETNTDPAFWIRRGNDYAVRYPYGGGDLTHNPCMFWGGAKVAKPVGNGPARLLMVQAEYDALTAREGALATFDTQPNARMVFVRNEYTHGVYPYGNECVDGRVVSYLLGEDDHVRRTECEGIHLPPLAPASTAASPPTKPRADTKPIYGDDAQSQRALQDIRTLLDRNAFGPPRR